MDLLASKRFAQKFLNTVIWKNGKLFLILQLVDSSLRSAMTAKKDLWIIQVKELEENVAKYEAAKKQQ